MLASHSTVEEIIAFLQENRDIIRIGQISHTWVDRVGSTEHIMSVDLSMTELFEDNVEPKSIALTTADDEAYKRAMSFRGHV